MQLQQPVPRRGEDTRMGGSETLENWDAGVEIRVELGVVAVVVVVGDPLVKQPAESVVLSGRESSVSRLGR